MRDLTTTASDGNNMKMTYNEFLNKYNTIKNKRTGNGVGDSNSSDNSSNNSLYTKSNNSSSSSLSSSCGSNGSCKSKVPYTSFQEYLKKYETKKFAPVKVVPNDNEPTKSMLPPIKPKPEDLTARPKISIKSELIVQISGDAPKNRVPIYVKQSRNNYENVARKLSQNFNNNNGDDKPSPPTASVSHGNEEEKVTCSTARIKEQNGFATSPLPPPPPPPMPNGNSRMPPPPPKMPPPSITSSHVQPSYATLPRGKSANGCKPAAGGMSPKDLLLDELMSKTKRYDPPETASQQLQRTASSPLQSPKISPKPTIAQLPNICTLPRPSKFPLPSPTFSKKLPYTNCSNNQLRPGQNGISKVSNEEANVNTVITVNDDVDSIVRSDPNVKRYVYNTYRGLLGAYNNKANEFISNTTGIIVKEDKGVSRQLESLALNGGLDKLNGRVNPVQEKE